MDNVVIVLSSSMVPPVGRLMSMRTERSLSFPIVIFLQVSDAAPSEADLSVEHSRGLQERASQDGEGRLHTDRTLTRSESQQFTPTRLYGDATQAFQGEHCSEKIM